LRYYGFLEAVYPGKQSLFAFNRTQQVLAQLIFNGARGFSRIKLRTTSKLADIFWFLRIGCHGSCGSASFPAERSCQFPL